MSSTKGRKTSKYAGVAAARGYSRPKWRAQVWDPQKQSLVHLGTHDIEELAAAAAAEYRGDLDEADRLRELVGLKKRPRDDEIERAMTPAEIAYMRGYRPHSNDKAVC